MPERVGLDCEAHYNNGGSWATPTWVEMASVIDVALPFERNMVRAASRASSWERFLVGLKKGQVDLKFLRDNTDAVQLALRAAFLAGNDLIFAFADGPIATAGTVYWKAEMKVSKWAHGEPLEDAATIDCTLVVSATSTNEPTFDTVPS